MSTTLTETTESVNSLVASSNVLLEIIKSPEGLAAVIAVGLISIVWKVLSTDFSYLFDLYERKEKKRLECIEKYIAAKDLAEHDTLRLVQELRDRYYFGVIAGFHDEKAMRNAVVALYFKTSHKILWKHILRAHPHISLNENGEAEISKFGLFDKLQYAYNTFFAWFSFLVVILFPLLLAVQSTKTFANVGWCLLGSTISLLFGLFLLTQNWPMDAAKRIT